MKIRGNSRMVTHTRIYMRVLSSKHRSLHILQGVHRGLMINFSTSEDKNDFQALIFIRVHLFDNEFVVEG